MTATDVFNLLQGAVTTILAIGAAAGALWALIGKRAWHTIRGIFQRLDKVEESQTSLQRSIEDTQAMNRDAFKDMREALTEEGEGIRALVTETRSATVTRLDRLNGKIAEHEKTINEHTIELARRDAADQAEQRIITTLQRSGRLPRHDPPIIPPDLEPL